MVMRTGARSVTRRRLDRPDRRASGPPRALAEAALRVESLEPRTLLSVAAVAPAGTEFRVNTTTLNSQSNPAVAMDAGGGSVVAWETTDGTGIRAQRYDAAGQPLGGEFRPSQAGGDP